MKTFNEYLKERNQQIVEYVEKRGDKWVVLNHERTKVLGTHDSKEEAERQLRAIEANK